jgi:hypothetical protein
MLRALVLSGIVTLCACVCAQAASASTQSARLEATFAPERLGGETTLEFGFQITVPAGQAPSPLLSMGLSYPNKVGVTISELGLATCELPTLVAHGLGACPGNSRMGLGSATVEIPLGSQLVKEHAHMDVVRAPEQEGHLAMIFDTEGARPVSAEIALPSVVVEAFEPFGGKVAIALPLIPSLPEAPNVAVVDLHAAIGPEHLIYSELVAGRVHSFRPHGIKLPRHCPRGGFPFAAYFAFLDGTHAVAQTVVPCPRHVRRAL